MNKEDSYIKNRIIELANNAYNKNIYTYSDFLNLNELNIYNNIKHTLPPVEVILTGGNVYAERKILVFKPCEVYYEEDVPITAIKIRPLNAKFSEQLSHRDFLGAILNLGIERSKIGDIFVSGENAYIYCLNSISDYISEHLFKVRHTNVSCSIYDEELEAIKPVLREVCSTISNIRLDSVIGSAFNKSRSGIVPYIEQGRVYVNGKLVTSNGYAIKENDIISVRGLGRCIFNKQLGVTKKGRNLISIYLYE